MTIAIFSFIDSQCHKYDNKLINIYNTEKKQRFLNWKIYIIIELYKSLADLTSNESRYSSTSLMR